MNQGEFSFSALFSLANSGIIGYNRPEARGQRPEARGQRPEARGQRPEARGQRPEA
jgi:hypothetical protein